MEKYMINIKRKLGVEDIKHSIPKKKPTSHPKETMEKMKRCSFLRKPPSNYKKHI